MRADFKVRFLCSECGYPLELKRPGEQDNATCHWAGDLEYNVKVEPCSQCIEKKTKDARTLAESLKGLLKYEE